MCRLLAFSLNENTDKQEKINLISNFRNLASVGAVPNGIEEGHVDGWGLSVYGNEELPFVYKSIFPADRDTDFISEEFLVDGSSQSGLVHLRKKTVGEASILNTHPFVDGNFSFIHNGTVEKGDGPYKELMSICESATDSERLFRQFLKIKGEKKTLEAYIEMLVSTRDNYPTYSALNTMLHDGHRVYISRIMNTNHPDFESMGLENYYTLYLGKTSDGDILITSEKLNYKDASYVLLKNNSVCVIDLEKGTQELLVV